MSIFQDHFSKISKQSETKMGNKNGFEEIEFKTETGKL